VKFRKKPVVIEAVQWDGRNGADVAAFCPGIAGVSVADGTVVQLEIKTLEGTMSASIGDWVIRGVKGEFYPCKPDIFEATYERVREAAHYPDGMGEESRRLHREYNELVRAQRDGVRNARDVIRVTDECNAKGITLVPGGENL
jgi:hypothetical protein